jgi:SAM-dependent methyltransferase
LCTTATPDAGATLEGGGEEVLVMAAVRDGMAVLSRPREVAVRALKGAARDWAGVPRGPLGWVATRWVMPRLHSAIYPVMGQAAQLREEDELLEVACGSGVFLDQQAGQVRRVVGLDLSDLQVGLARERLAARIAAGTAEIVKGDAGALPWPDATFTVVTCMGSFEAFPEPERVLTELFRVLRPGGRAVLNIGERVAPGTATHRVWGEIWVWSEEDVRDMVERAGFTDLAITYASSAGDSRLLRVVDRFSGAIGQDLRIVHGTRPAELPTASRSGSATR